MESPQTQTTNKMLEAALAYIRKGVSIVPVNGKIPRIKWEEFQTRKPTEEEIRTWWNLWPDAGIALITGKISNVTVVDVEAGGDVDRFPITTTIRTGGGGWHLYYQYFPINNKARIFHLTDIRGDGGYVVAPPSMHSSGQEYSILKPIPPAPFPAVLFQQDEVKVLNNEIRKKLNEIVPEGQRNDTATAVCGKMLMRFKEYEWQGQAWPLFLAWNETHNEPPLPIRELLTIFRSIADAERKKILSGQVVGEAVLVETGDTIVIHVPIAEGFAVFEFEDVEYSARSIDCVVRCSIEMPEMPQKKFSQRINILSGSAKESFCRQLKEAFKLSKDETGWPLIFSQACELLTKQLDKQSEEELYDKNAEVNTQYLIKPFIEEGAHNIIFGAGGTGKTYLTLGMAVSLALNKPFLGIKPEKSVNILFIDYENTAPVWSSRIKKISNAMEVGDGPAILERIFYFNPKGAPIYDIKYQLAKVIRRRNIGLVIIDSAALACGGEPEGANIANRLFNALGWLKVTTLVIAHETKNSENKNKTPFGSIFFFNCARNIWNVSKKQDLDATESHIGLLHRKSNNDMMSSPRAAVIKFAEGKVHIDFESNERFVTELSLKERILGEIREGVHSRIDIAKNLKENPDQISSRAKDLISEGILVSPARGYYDFPQQQDVDKDNDDT